MKKLTSILIVTIIFFSIHSNAQSGKAKGVFNHIALYVVDMQKSGDFYMNVIGLDTIPEPFHDGKHIWLRLGPVSHLHLIEGAERPKEYFKNNHYCFSVPSVEAFTEKLKARGIPWEDMAGTSGAITTRVDKVRQIWLRDPDGYWVEINDAKE